MAHLLSAAAAQGLMPDYIGKVLAVLDAEKQKRADHHGLLSALACPPAPDRPP